MKTLTKRSGRENPIQAADSMQKTINKLRNSPLVSKGLYHFKTHKEADEWMMKQMARTHARQKSKT